MPPNKPEIVGGPPFKPNLPKLKFEMPGKAAAIIGLLFVLIIGGMIFIQLCFTYIRPNELGIKQVNLGPNSGIQEKVYTPGFAFRLPGVEQIHRFPQHVQLLDLTDKSDRGMVSRYTDPMAKIQTSDGFFVDVEVSILYKIKDPYLLITTLGKGTGYLQKGIIPKAQPTLKETLGTLTTEEFYVSPLRVAKAELARDLLNEELLPMGLEVQHVLVRFFRYSDVIQKNIEEKKLQDQLVFKNQSEAKAKIELAVLRRVTENGVQNVEITLQEGRAYKIQKDAERDLYVRSKEAEANLLVQLAEAKRTELKNAAMEAAGADRAVALEMAEVLRGLDVLILPSGGETGVNPLDLDGVIDLFGVQSDRGAVARQSTGAFEAAEAVGGFGQRVPATVEEN